MLCLIKSLSMDISVVADACCHGNTVHIICLLSREPPVTVEFPYTAINVECWYSILLVWPRCWTNSQVAVDCPECQTYEIATRFWVVVICPIIKYLTVLEFSFILFDLCLFIAIFKFILNYVLIVTFWIFTYHKIWILLIIYCFIWNYWIIYFLTCLEVFWSVVS